MIDKPKVSMFYGWWIVLSGMVMGIYTAGIFFYGFTALFNPLRSTFGWSRTTMSVAFTLQRGETGVAGPVVGFLVDRFGPRRIILAGLVVMGIGLFSLTQINNLGTFYAAYFIASVGFSGCSPLVANIPVANWFRRKRARAMGILALGAGISGLLLPGIVALIEWLGWRTTLGVLGIGLWVICMPLALVFRQRPEQYGLRPDGDLSTGVEIGEGNDRNKSTYTLKETLRRKSFWALAAVHALWLFAHTGVVVHIIPALTLDAEMTAGNAGLMAAGIPVLSILGRVGFGWLGDFLDKRYVLMMAVGFQIFGLLLFRDAPNFAVIGLGVILYGIGIGGFIPVRNAVQADLFGRINYGKVQGMVELFAQIGGIGGPVVTGLIADSQGTYSFAFLILAICPMIAIPIIRQIREN